MPVDTTLGIIALIFYLLAASKLGVKIYNNNEDGFRQTKRIVLSFGAIAIILNGIILRNAIFSGDSIELGFSNAWALISWFIALVVMLISVRKPIENLLVIIFPLAAFGIIVLLFSTRHHIPADSIPMGIKIHILLSIVAYSLLTIASFQAALLAFQEHELSHRRPALIMKILPPMQVMENTMIRIIVVGFFMLSLSLVTGFMFVHDIFAQHLMHKTILSALSWFVFALLLWGRWQMGWRGQKLIRWTLGGFLMLMLAFFGTKLILELIFVHV